ncbi:glycogen synthase GlgA [Bacillus marinisedimentorum]|uniref:glycogen synthase GlgA n=1 Tax=Bacillus marinisedimentorum TaxID=1821260 RepID=UPI0007E1DDF2|nr:glycogen synthase GlgA [Bacillus marinisedimentorum]
MNILFAASEGYPFSKTGGLGDVIGALPKELAKEGADVQVVLPKYASIPEQFAEDMTYIASLTVPVGWRNQYCGLFSLEKDGVLYYFIDNEYYFKRPDSYGYYDDGERFAFFSRAILEIIPFLEKKPDVLHLHDWQTAMASLLLKAHYRYHPDYQQIKTVFTIHNLRYQGVFPHSVLHDLYDLSNMYFHPDGVEYYGNVNFMKAGIVYSDAVTTVSPSYAEEIQTPYYGEGLDGLLRKHNGKLTGILNGIDTDLYNPNTDSSLYVQYEHDLEAKAQNKVQLQRELGLEENRNKPMIVLISRLTDQKGIDLILHVMAEMASLDMQFVVLGTGEKRYEEGFRQSGEHFRENLSVHLMFDDSFARKLYGASDILLMPSVFEPCGISQLLALRYGSLPIVRETGGLKDTVKPHNRFTGEGHGFSFANYNAHELLFTIERAIHLYHERPQVWKRMARRALELDFSWNASSLEYLKLYHSL